MNPLIQQYGWSDPLGLAFEPYAALGCVPARVLVQQRGAYVVVSPDGERHARLSAHLIHEAEIGGFPVAGDWVALRQHGGDGEAIIQAVLPRRTECVRKAAGTGQRPQVVAANIDVALLVVALAEDFNLRRLERYLAVACQSGAKPIVVLTKADLCPNLAARRSEAEAVAFGCPVLEIRALTGEGVAEVAMALKPGETCVLLGSSGAGKSTLINALAGQDLMTTAPISERDGRGLHTTTHRQLMLLPAGWLMIDTPGMRELGLLDADEGVGTVFADIEALAEQCRFRNCSHGSEPGCAILKGLEDGSLDADRWHSFEKLRKELAHLERKEDRLAREATRKRWAAVAKSQRQLRKLRDRP
jgi:ribosome biogenesis GTPase